MCSSKYTTVVDPDLIRGGGGGGGHPGPGMGGGGGLNNFFLALRASVWSRSKVLFSQPKKEVNVNCDYRKKKLSRQRTTKI